jgi:CHAD domain-containing protein
MAGEVELKFETDEGFHLPDMAGLPGVASVPPAEQWQLEATYYYTADLRLATHRHALRRRTGGHDAGWHLKRPRADGFRDEIQEPLGDPDEVPASLRRFVEVYARGRALVPVVRLTTRRTATTLRDAAGRPLLELAADDVTASVLGSLDGGGDHVTTWHELEAELVEGDLPLLGEVEACLLAAGARLSASPSKLARALGDRLDVRQDGQEIRQPGLGTAAAALQRYLRDQAEALQAQDPLVRIDAPDAVHQMRVGCRRLRAVLAAYRHVVDADRVEPVRDELRWLGEVLGGARDSEVVRDRLRAEVQAQPAELVLGPVERRIVETFATRYREAHDRVLMELSGKRYFALLDAVDALVADPPLGPRALEPASVVFRTRLRKTYRRTARHVDLAIAEQNPTQREHLFHEVRKSAKRARYAAEAATEVLGRAASRYGKAMKALQELLGEQQDSVVARAELLALGIAAYGDGENAFTYGRLHGLEQGRAAAAIAVFDPAWRKVRRRRLS